MERLPPPRHPEWASVKLGSTSGRRSPAVQPHRLRALILEDLERFPGSGRGDIHRRIGPEIHTKTLARALEALLKDGQIVSSGERRWRTYRLSPAKGHAGSEGGGGKG